MRFTFEDFLKLPKATNMINSGFGHLEIKKGSVRAFPSEKVFLFLFQSSTDYDNWISLKNPTRHQFDLACKMFEE